MSNTNKYGNWYETEVGSEIVKKKYCHDGEKTFPDVARRIKNCFPVDIGNKIEKMMLDADFFFGGRALYALGCKGKFVASTSNCYVLPSPTDDLESIIDVSKEMAVIFSKGGGTGLNLSNLRPRGAKVNNVAKTSTGAVSFMELYNTIGKVISQNGRRGALLIGLNCDHPDIEEFLKIKQDNTSIQSANISILFTDEFMEAVNNHEDYELKFTLESGEVITKTINAYDFFMDFCESNKDYGEPGAIFIDRVRGWHLLSEDGDYKIEISNP